MPHARAVDRLLRHLEVPREAPSLDHLDRLVAAHQRRVPFETFTKLIDHAPGRERGDYLPPFEEYVERIVERGAGGLCWTLARGFHELLTDLGYEASYMVMRPGHACLRVEMPAGPYYADVGYAAPLFRAYPLFRSFRVDSEREAFTYDVRDEGILVTRQPGPTKTLDPAPRTLPELHALIAAANDWRDPQSFLRRLAYAAYVGGEYTSLNGVTLRRHRPDGLETTTIDPDERPDVLRRLFGVDPALVRDALEAQRRLEAMPPSSH